MPFQKGNKLSKGRPQGFKNKTTDVDKKDLQELFFNVEEMKKDFLTLDAYKKYDVRMKAMSYFYSRPAIDMNIESTKYLDNEFIVCEGEEVTAE